MSKKVIVSYGRTIQTSVQYESIRIDASTEMVVSDEVAEKKREAEFEKLKKFIDKKVNETRF